MVKNDVFDSVWPRIHDGHALFDMCLCVVSTHCRRTIKPTPTSHTAYEFDEYLCVIRFCCFHFQFQFCHLNDGIYRDRTKTIAHLRPQYRLRSRAIQTNV